MGWASYRSIERKGICSEICFCLMSFMILMELIPNACCDCLFSRAIDYGILAYSESHSCHRI